MVSRKRAVSIRMTASDIGSVKKLAKRIGASDSEVIRCAVKMMMTKFAPLADGSMRGKNLLPVFVECGSDLLRYFDLDAIRLESIINEGAAQELQVDAGDIQLLAGNGEQRSFVRPRPDALVDVSGRIEGGKFGQSNGNGSHAESHNNRATNCFDDSLRRYLYEKYDYRIASVRKQSNDA